MLDKRCKYKVRETSPFYLFRKHREIYYAYYPLYKLTRSTGETNIINAYSSAQDILVRIKLPPARLYSVPEDKKRQRDLRKVQSFISDISKPLTPSIIKSLQKKLLDSGLSIKSVNNYIYVLRRYYNEPFPYYKPITGHVAEYRSCFPITSFYGFYSKCNTRLHYIAFIAMTTGARVGELKHFEVDGEYLWILGTKTKNAKRRIPLLPETKECLHYLEGGLRTAGYKESVVESGKLVGFDSDYIEENRIVFHSFRKMYKTLLESCNIPNTFIEYYMGHAQSDVNNLYFIGDKADDSEIYPKVIEALRRFV